MRQFKPGQLQTGSLYNISASYAVTASYLQGYISPFPFTGSARITGSLGVTGSISTTTQFYHPDSLDSSNRTLTDQNANTSVNWHNRWLVDATGQQPNIKWDDTNTFGITTIPIIENFNDERISDELQDSYDNERIIVSGKILERADVIGGLTDGTLVYYNKSNAQWENFSQSSISHPSNFVTGSIGVVCNGGVDVLLEGTITTIVNSTDPTASFGPTIIGDPLIGSPLFAAGSLLDSAYTVFSTQYPTANKDTQRMLGHIIGKKENLATGIDGYLIYFNPSNDFYTLVDGGRIGTIDGNGMYAAAAGTAVSATSASYATSALFASSASYALTASYSNNLVVSGSIANVDYIDFNTGSATPAWKAGRVFWDNTDGALSVYNAEADVTLHVGQENWTRVSNRTGATILNGTVVRLKGAHGDVPEVELAQSIQVSGSVNIQNQILGVATHDIEDNSKGYITTQGLVRGLNTNAFSDGDTLFVGTGSAGVLQNTAPRAPFEIIPVGVCVKASPGTSGIIYVAVQEPIDFSDLSSALVDGTYNYGDIWTYVRSGSSGVWTHTNQLSGSYAITGSLTATSFTGNVQGNASTATTASYVETKTVFNQPILGTGNIGFVSRSFSPSIGSNSTGETQLLQLPIPANTFSATDKLSFFAVFSKVGTATNFTARVKLTTSSSMPAGNTSQIAQSANTTTATLYFKISRDLFISSGSLFGISFFNSTITDTVASTNPITSASFDVTQTQYLYVSAVPTTTPTADVIRLEAFEIKNI